MWNGDGEIWIFKQITKWRQFYGHRYFIKSTKPNTWKGHFSVGYEDKLFVTTQASRFATGTAGAIFCVASKNLFLSYKISDKERKAQTHLIAQSNRSLQSGKTVCVISIDKIIHYLNFYKNFTH